MAAKKKDWTELLGGPAKTDSTDTDSEAPKEPPVTVFMHTIVGNPENPRSEEDYTDEDPEFLDLKASMKEIGQLQPLAVLSRHVFEQAKSDLMAHASPTTRKMIQDAEWVVVTGNRRLAAARQLGWTRIDIRVQDRLGDEDGMVDEAVIIENIHRKNLAPIKEAEFLRRMVERHGSQDKVAERIGKSQMYVSHRLALLKLAPDVQAEVDAGAVKLKDARQLAGQTQDHAEQRKRVEELKKQAAQPKPPRPPRPQPKPPVQNPVLKPNPSSAAQPPAAGLQNPVFKAPPAAPETTEAIPEPRANGAPPAGDQPATLEDRQPPKLPYDDGIFLGQHLSLKVDNKPYFLMLHVLLEKAEEKDPQALASLLARFTASAL
jgi:ParB family chromosome partitioning protein